jgi:hypothetical protein
MISLDIPSIDPLLYISLLEKCIILSLDIKSANMKVLERELYKTRQAKYV